MGFLSKAERENMMPNDDTDPRFLHPHYIAMKCKLDQILKNKNIKGIIDDTIYRINIITFHTYNFLQLYILQKYDNHFILPIIDKNFISYIMYVITKKINKRGKPWSFETNVIIEHLTQFYEKHYKPLISDHDIIIIDKLNYVLNYEENDILKNIINNITEHYFNHIRKLINITFGLDQLISEADNDKKKIKEIYEEFNKIYNDLISIDNNQKFTSDKKYHQWIDSMKFYILPRENHLKALPKKPVKPKKIKMKQVSKKSGSKKSNCRDIFKQNKIYERKMILYKEKLKLYEQNFKKEYDYQHITHVTPINKAIYSLDKEGKENIYTDIYKAPFDYLYPMIFINREIDKINQTIKKNHTDKNTHPKIHKLFHVLPLRTSIIPSYITFDTSSLINLFIKEGQGEYLKNFKKDNLYNEIWRKFFYLRNKIFTRKGYKFDYMIKTDGLACSLIFAKVKDGKKYLPLEKKSDFQKFEELSEAKYIEDHCKNNIKTNRDVEKFLSKNIIYMDPGKTDLFQAMGNNEGEKFFSYSRAQRDHDMRKRRYQKIRQYLKYENLIDDKTIYHYENELSKHDSKITNFEKFKEYLKIKIKTNNILYSFYKKEDHRKLKWNSFNNKKRSEDTMLNKLEDIYGDPKNCIIILGDFSEKESKKEPNQP